MKCNISQYTFGLRFWLCYDFLHPSKRKLLAQFNKECKMSDWLGVDDVVKVLEEVGVQVVVLPGQCVKVNHHIFLHCDVVHHMDEVQQGLHTQKQTKSECIHFYNPGFSIIFYLFYYNCNSFFFYFSSTSLGLIAGLVTFWSLVYILHTQDKFFKF